MWILITAGIADGWWRGAEPRSQFSMTIMRPPQQGRDRTSVVPSSTPGPSSIPGAPDGQKLAHLGKITGRSAVGEEAVVADAMQSFGENVNQEPANELTRRQRHDLVAAGAFDAVVFDAERHARRIRCNDPPVGYGDAMSVAREIGEHGLWT